jgi:hypothetical protein
MQFDTASRLVTLTREIYPSSRNDDDTTIDLWMGLFGTKDDGLMETALRSCYLSCKFWPTPADITEAIKDLQYVEQTKPKQLAWDVKRTGSLHQKIMDMATGKTDTKEYLASVDISEMKQYAKVFFPDISDELVLKNYPEFAHGMESQAMCFACRVDKSVCITGGYQVRHWINKDGTVKNEMKKCEK